MNAIGKTLGVKINENNVTFDSILAGIGAGRYQIANSSFTDTKAREKQVYFVDYFQAGEAVYAKKSSSVKFTGLPSLCGLTVAVETGTTEQSDAVNTAKTCATSKKLSILAYPTQTSADLASPRVARNSVSSTVRSRVTWSLSPRAPSSSWVTRSKSRPTAIGTPKTAAGKGLAMAIKAAVKTLIANGTYGAILAKWGVSSGALPTSKIVLDGATS